MRKHVPLAAGAGEVEDRVENLAAVVDARPTGLVDRDQGFDDGSLFVAEIGRVGLTHRGMLRRRRVVRTSCSDKSLRDPTVIR